MENSQSLIDLYHEDRRLDFLAKRLAELPDSLAALDAETAERAAERERRLAEAAELEEALRRLERDGQMRRDELTKLQKQQKQVASVEALTASETATARCEQLIAELEEKSLVKLEAQEIHARENELRARREEAEAESLVVERVKLEEEQADCLLDREATEARRLELIAGLEKGLRRRYERIHQRQGHRTLAPLRGENCGGCGEHIPPQDYLEIKDRRAVLPCQGCGRLVMRTEN
jgi:uncharacterized protein